MDDFERLLYQGAAQPPRDLPEPPRPWKRPMDRICWGLILVTVTLNFFYLDAILPAVGTVLLWLGLRALRRENGGFRFAFCCATAYALLRSANMAALATPLSHWLAGRTDTEWHTGAGTMPFYEVVFAVVVQLTLVLAVAGLWLGLKAAFRGAGQEPRTGCAGAMVVMEALLIPLCVIGVSGWLLVGPLLLIWILTVRNLFRLSRSLDEAGYALAPAPVKVSDGLAAGLWLGTVALAVAVLSLCFTRLPVESAAVEAAPTAQTELREQLAGLGFPAEILDELTDEEVARFRDAYGVTVKGWPLERGEYRDGIPSATILEVPVRDGRDGWRVVYLARLAWDQGVDYRMEGIRLRPDYHGVVSSLDGPEGALRWEADGGTRTAPLTFRRAGWMDYVCDFSLPETDGQVTGYVFWAAAPHAPKENRIYNYGVMLAHRTALWQWPYTLPSEVLEDSGAPWAGWRLSTRPYTGQLAPEEEYRSGQSE